MLRILDNTLIGKRIKYLFIRDEFFRTSERREIAKKRRNKFQADISQELHDYLSTNFDIDFTSVRVELPSTAIPTTRHLDANLRMLGILKFSSNDVEPAFYPFHVEGATRNNTIYKGDYLWYCKNDRSNDKVIIIELGGLSCPGLEKHFTELRAIFDKLITKTDTYDFPDDDSCNISSSSEDEKE